MTFRTIRPWPSVLFDVHVATVPPTSMSPFHLSDSTSTMAILQSLSSPLRLASRTGTSNAALLQAVTEVPRMSRMSQASPSQVMAARITVKPTRPPLLERKRRVLKLYVASVSSKKGLKTVPAPVLPKHALVLRLLNALTIVILATTVVTTRLEARVEVVSVLSKASLQVWLIVGRRSTVHLQATSHHPRPRRRRCRHHCQPLPPPSLARRHCPHPSPQHPSPGMLRRACTYCKRL